MSVVIPSYRRPKELRRCLCGVAGLSVTPDETIVILRPEDTEGRRVALEEGARIADVTQPGHVPPLIAGLATARGEVMAILDDDAVPHRDWLRGILARFSGPDTAAVGGPINEALASTDVEGSRGERLNGFARRGRTWYGGLESLPLYSDFSRESATEAAPSDHLSGGNFAVRTALMRKVGFDMRLNRGAGVAWEADVCLGLKRYGAVIFDPAIVVDHFSAPRSDTPRRDDFERFARDYSYSLFYIAGKRFGAGELLLFLTTMMLIGQQASPGLARSFTDRRGTAKDTVRFMAGVWRARTTGLCGGIASRLASVRGRACHRRY